MIGKNIFYMITALLFSVLLAAGCSIFSSDQAPTVTGNDFEEDINPDLESSISSALESITGSNSTEENEEFGVMEEVLVSDDKNEEAGGDEDS
jgi:hypothetical protein